jgi:arginine dihydrolase
MRNLLLCPPDFYGIQYEINPWMDRTHNALPILARDQWSRLRDTLESLGCHIELLPPQPGLPDMVFTANAGLVSGKRFIRSNFRFAERRGEEPYFEAWFAERGYDCVELPPERLFEGEGDALFFGEVLFCGYRFRSDIRSHQKLGEILGCLVVSVELIQERYYHLDTCFCPLPGFGAIWFPGAFDEYGQKAIQHQIPKLIDVSPAEAANFACNAIVLEQEVILPEKCPQLCAALHAQGYRTHELSMTEFLKAGGACKCLALFI